MKIKYPSILIILVLTLALSLSPALAQNTFYISADQTYVLPENLSPQAVGGDTIKISSDRIKTLQFKGFEGNEDNPIIFINDGGQVNINTTDWGAIRFVNCKFIKITGTGDANTHYGFKLQGGTTGLSFEEYSSDVEIEFVEIEGLAETFFGIYAKKDFSGNAVMPYPVFNNLSIHDNYIHDVAEGMYIGETTAPGMEFRHLRIYNNIIINTQRESMQIGNSVDDIEIYNNFFQNTGIENMKTQNNNLQIGINSVGLVYNNVIMESNGYGVIILGNGDITLENNFIANSQGIYIDDRYTPLSYAPINIIDNYISGVNNNTVIENLNEFNDLYIANNFYSPDSVFFKNAIASTSEIILKNNLATTVADFKYTITNGIFQNSLENSAAYQAMGPVSGLTHTFNESPVLDSIDNVIILYSESETLNLTASTSDSDQIHFEGQNIPDFMQLVETGSGTANLNINPSIENIGVYRIGILVYDESHQSYDRQELVIAIKDPSNQNPVFSFETSFSLEATTKSLYDITAIDADNDSILYSINSNISFAKIKYEGNQVFLDLQPKIEDQGVYQIEVKADDCYGSPSYSYLTLTITPATLSAGHLLYRVNFGGPELEDELMNWQADIDIEAKYGTTHFLRTGSWFFKGVNNTSAPDALFGPYRYDGAEGIEMQFEFPLPNEGVYTVKLFFAERDVEVNALETGIFNVILENDKILDNFNILQNAGMEAYELSYDVTVLDGILNLDFEQRENKDKINGIEISYQSEILTNQTPQVQTAETITINENEVMDFPIYILDDAFEGCNSLSLSPINLPSFVSITEITPSEFTLTLQPDFQDAGDYTDFVLVASDGCLTDSLTVNIQVKNVNRLPILQNIDPLQISVGTTITIDILSNDEDNDVLSLIVANAPNFVTLTDLGNGLGNFEINPSLADTGNYYFELTVIDEFEGSSSIDVNFLVFEMPTSDRIILDNTMVTDLVTGLSNTSPLFLVDEQNLDPLMNQHPSSASWIPTKRAESGIFETMIDLGKMHYLEIARVHDMKNTQDLHISVGEPGNWTEISIYNTSLRTVWSEIDMQIETQYVLLTMLNTNLAQINELALYGYTSDAIPDIVENQAPEIQTSETIRITENEEFELPISLVDDAFALCNNLNLELINGASFMTLNKIDNETYSMSMLPSTADIGDYTIELFASDGCLEHTLAISVIVTVFNADNIAPTISNLDSTALIIGYPVSIDVNSSDIDGDALFLFTVNAPDFVILNDYGNGQGSLEINPTMEDAGNFDVEVIVEDEFGASSSTFINIQTYIPPTVDRILLNSTMITDLVSGGSDKSPNLLVDEQTLDPYFNEHPRSKSWVPLKRVALGEYSVIIDLGEEYYLDHAMLHDMSNTANLEIFIGAPDNWTNISTYNTSEFKVWSEIQMKHTTRYLLLSMINTINAQINEIALYGYLMSPAKRTEAFIAIEEQADFTVYPNPAKDRVFIRNKTEDQKLEVYNLTGRLMLSTYESQVDLFNLQNGVYIIRVIGEDQILSQSKFIKID